MAYSHIILASNSPRRKFLLEQMGLRFEVFPADVEEDNTSFQSPVALVQHNAQLKAEWVAQKMKTDLVLGSDTTVALGPTIFNKPHHRDEAKMMLNHLSGKVHSVYTGVCLIAKDRGLIENHVVESKVTFKHLDDATIERYFSLVNPLDKAGAYGIQAGKDIIVESLEGSLNNVMGLPTEFLETLLIKMDSLHCLKKG